MYTHPYDVVVFYHADCMDGMAAAWAFKKLCTSRACTMKFYPVKYGKPPPDHQFTSMCRTSLYILDFSYSREVLEELCLAYSDVTVIDHHKTAKEDLTGEWKTKPYNLTVDFDLYKSGASATWSFMTNDPLPPLIKYVEDRDLWKFELLESKAVNAYIAAHDLTLESYDRLNDNLNSLDSCIEIGTILLKAHTKHVKSIIANSKRAFYFQGYEGLICNCSPMFASDVGDELVKESGTFGITYYIDSEDIAHYSIRSNEASAVDVSIIAKKFGGGGHRNAAGFHIDLAKGPLKSIGRCNLWVGTE